MLNKQQLNFNKNIENVDIRTLVDEVLQIQNDKVKMMEIEVKVNFQGFSNQYLIKTD
jgi:hypothetical protein